MTALPRLISSLRREALGYLVAKCHPALNAILALESGAVAVLIQKAPYGLPTTV